jgi:protein-L-isoaspartate(D-aspartate) O-methyltransferase
MKVNKFGSANVFSWDKDYFLKIITNGKHAVVSDPVLISAFKHIDRADFLPSHLKNLAYYDQDIDIGYGEKAIRPMAIAQMLSSLKPKSGGRYLDIGTGTGYVATLLGFIAGKKGIVYTMERVQWLWEQARNNAKKYSDIKNITFLYRDGFEGLPTKAPFDGIRIGFAIDDTSKIRVQLKKNGYLVYPGHDYSLRVVHKLDINEYEEEIIPGIVVDKGKVGVV